MSFVLSKIEECSSASEVAQSVSVLHAIRWVTLAWRNVKADTIMKCFRAAGILTGDFNVASLPTVDEDPFADLDTADDLQSMMSQLPETCSAKEYLLAEDLPTCASYDSESWEDSFLDEVEHRSKRHKESEEAGEDSSSDEDTEEPHSGITQCRISTLAEAMSSVEDICKFLDLQGHTTEATEACQLLDKLAILQQKKQHLKQTTLDKFFS